MKNAYGYKVHNGYTPENLCHTVSLIIFADTESIADEYINNFVNEQIEADKYENDYGEIVNHWWKYTSIEKADIASFNNSGAGIRWLESKKEEVEE